MKLQPPRGTRDLTPEDIYAWKTVLNQILGVTLSYGFHQVETPVFENIEVFEIKSGPAIRDQIYTLEDKGGRTLGLRSDLTPAIARLVAAKANAWPKPIRLSCSDRVWRYEAPQAGRYREIHHVNAEMFGLEADLGDPEIIACFVDAYRAIGLPDVAILIGHRTLLQDILRTFDVPEASLDDVVRTLDKWGKIPADVLRAELEQTGVASAALPALMDIASFEAECTDGLERLRAMLPSDSRLDRMLRVMADLFATLESYGVTEVLRLRPGLARGFDYYTGVLFECVCPEAPSYGAIGGGGRYDTLIETYGAPSLPAVGFAMGIDRIMLVLDHLGRRPTIPSPPQTDYFIVPVADDARADAIELAQELRHAGRIVELGSSDRSVRKQLDAAAKRGAREAVTVEAGKSAAAGLVVRNLIAGGEQRLSVAEFISGARNGNDR